MSTSTLGTIIGEPKQGITYAGRWYVNANVSTNTSGDRTLTPSQMTLDTSFNNVNANALVSSNTSGFAIQLPVQGIWAILWMTRGNVTVPATSTQDVWTYIGMHTYNGVSNKSIGSAPDISFRHAMLQNTWSNPTTGSFSTFAQHCPTITEEFKAGDIIAPWYGLSTTAGYVLNGGENSGTQLTVVLLRRTA